MQAIKGTDIVQFEAQSFKHGPALQMVYMMLPVFLAFVDTVVDKSPWDLQSLQCVASPRESESQECVACYSVIGK